jgi:predicted NodU family carbamoyl transferase
MHSTANGKLIAAAEEERFRLVKFQICEEKRSPITSITHVDGSGWLQTVHQRTNPRYH